MSGATRTRLAGGLVLALAMIVLANEPTSAVAQKPYAQAEANKKVHPIAPTLPPGQKLTVQELARHFDSLIAKRLKEDKADASPLCSDEEFLRRAYLDITGKIPTADKAVAFLDSKEPDKRAKLIDALLASGDYGKHQADVWQAMLLPRNGDNRRFQQYYPNMVKWLEERFNANTPWDKLVREIMTASGEVDETGPVVFWLANPTADKVTDSVSRVFLGVQLQCAQCHNHPFTDWKQDEYWGMAAFFLKVRPDGNPKAAAKNGKGIRISENSGPKKGKKGPMLPESAKILPPKFLQGEKPKVSPSGPARPVLAAWMTNAKNPFFGKAMVNRTLSQLFGRGFVAPVDDMHDGNAASHPELLADLTQQFVASGFDLKYLIRAVCNSETYQRSSKPSGNNADHGPETFARMAVKPLTPEQMFDALTQLMGSGRPAAGKGKGPQAQRGGGNPREAFVAFFAAEDGADPTEYHTGIPQVLRLMNSPQYNNGSALGPILREYKKPEEAVARVYLTVLARRPTAEELERVLRYLAKYKNDPRQGMAGVLWALMNSSEFALNR